MKRFPPGLSATAASPKLHPEKLITTPAPPHTPSSPTPELIKTLF